MTDPTIPELVARLRELHSARRYPTETLATTIRDDQSAQVYATSTGPMRAVRPVAETTVDHADLIAETLNALPAILAALDHIGDANKMAAHSPDGGKAGELDHAECSVSTGIDGALTAGQGELAPSGYWEHPCHECADRANASEVRRLQDIVDDLESRSTWRPITQVPTAEEHAWCGGRYLLQHDDDDGCEELAVLIRGHEDIVAFLRHMTWVRGWLPIPPSDERRW